jgi:ABC-type sugar transport system permease subunit
LRKRQERRFIAAFLGPPFLIYAVFVLWPTLTAFRYSLLRWDGLSAPVWVGFKNFTALLSSKSGLPGALGHNLYLMCVPGPLILCLALFFAYTIHQRVWGARVFRIAFFFPNILSSVAVALLWQFLYSTAQPGLINGVRHWIDPHSAPFPFLQSGILLRSLVPMLIWTATGFYMVLFLAAMENIPVSFYEAARLDGADAGQQFFHITLPLMWDVLTTGIIFLVIGSLKTFDTIWVLENGRPNADTHVLSTLMYSKVFEEYNIGYGTAIAVVLFLFALSAALITRRFLQRESLEY